MSVAKLVCECGSRLVVEYDPRRDTAALTAMGETFRGYHDRERCEVTVSGLFERGEYVPPKVLRQGGQSGPGRHSVRGAHGRFTKQTS